MKGIILSGGHGTRLKPLTNVTSKQLLPIYNKPMIFYPLETLLKAGIQEILIIVAPDHCGDYMRVLGSGKDFGSGVRFTYEIQDKPEGLAQAFLLAENFLDDGDSVALILGDNIFEHDFTEDIQTFESGGLVFAREVPDPERFGVLELDANGKVLSLEEKPTQPKSNLAQVGLYIFDGRVVEAAKTVKPSARGELEITDVANWYAQKNELTARTISGFWIDAGTFSSYATAFAWAEERENNLTPRA